MPSYIHDAALTFEYPEEPQARTIERAILPEIGDIGSERSVTDVERDGVTLRFVVRAEDLVALRAGLNTWLSLVKVAEKTMTVPD